MKPNTTVKVIITVSVIVLVAVAYAVGHSRGEDDCAKRHLPPEYWQELVKLERSFLRDVLTRPSTLTSGSYVLETRFPGKPAETRTLDLVVTNGQLVMPRRMPIQDFIQKGSVLSWEEYDADEGPSAMYVGLIDGPMVWGRVYVLPGVGWREGEPPAVGVWRLYLKPQD